VALSELFNGLDVSSSVSAAGYAFPFRLRVIKQKVSVYDNWKDWTSAPFLPSAFTNFDFAHGLSLDVKSAYASILTEFTANYSVYSAGDIVTGLDNCNSSGTSIGPIAIKVTPTNVKMVIGNYMNLYYSNNISSSFYKIFTDAATWAKYTRLYIRILYKKI
jgi:hypothetical protein